MTLFIYVAAKEVKTSKHFNELWQTFNQVGLLFSFLGYNQKIETILDTFYSFKYITFSFLCDMVE